MSLPLAVHVSPHPDDEAIGCPVTLQRFLRNGWRVIDINISKGRPKDHDRRTDERIDALQRAGIEGRSLEPSVATSGGDDHDAAQKRIEDELPEHLDELQPDIVISPHPHDAHHGHELVGRGVQNVLERSAAPAVWWTWGLWNELQIPNLYIPFDDSDLGAAQHVLGAYPSQHALVDYRKMIEGNGLARKVRSTGIVFGFGTSAPSDAPYAEVLMELTRVDGSWLWSKGRLVDFATPLVDESNNHRPAVDHILSRKSDYQELQGLMR